MRLLEQLSFMTKSKNLLFVVLSGSRRRKRRKLDILLCYDTCNEFSAVIRIPPKLKPHGVPNYELDSCKG